MARATSSLPVPGSPSMSTVLSLRATSGNSSRTLRMAELFETMSSQV